MVTIMPVEKHSTFNPTVSLDYAHAVKKKKRQHVSGHCHRESSPVEKRERERGLPSSSPHRAQKSIEVRNGK